MEAAARDSGETGRAVAQVQEKYAALMEAARGNAEQEAELQRSLDAELATVRAEGIAAQREEELQLELSRVEDKYSKLEESAKGHTSRLVVLEELKQERLISFTGLGGTTAYELPRVMATGYFDVVLTAFNYSLLWREALIAVFPEARRQEMGIIVGSPLQQGALARRFDAEIRDGAPWMSPPRREQYRRLYAYLDEIAIPLPELGLRMVLSNPQVSTVLMGVRSVAEVEENVRSAERGPLPAEVLARLQEIADRVPFRPYEEPFGLPFGSRTRRGPGVA